MEMTFRYHVYHLILHWNGNSLPLQLCSQPLNGKSFAIDRLGKLFPFPVLLILSLPFFFFVDDDYIGCLDEGVSVSL
jgi:hypothetical protein